MTWADPTSLVLPLPDAGARSLREMQAQGAGA
jgi:hypothetical protein